MLRRWRPVGPRGKAISDCDNNIWTGFQLCSGINTHAHICSPVSNELDRTRIKYFFCYMGLRIAGDHRDWSVQCFDDVLSLSESVAQLLLGYACACIDYDGDMRPECNHRRPQYRFGAPPAETAIGVVGFSHDLGHSAT